MCGQVKEVFEDVQLRYDVVINDLQQTIEVENVNESPLLDNRMGHPMTWLTYHSTQGGRQETGTPHSMTSLSQQRKWGYTG